MGKYILSDVRLGIELFTSNDSVDTFNTMWACTIVDGERCRDSHYAITDSKTGEVLNWFLTRIDGSGSSTDEWFFVPWFAKEVGWADKLSSAEVMPVCAS